MSVWLQFYGVIVGFLVCAAGAGFAINDARNANDTPRERIKAAVFACVFLIASCGLIADLTDKLP